MADEIPQHSVQPDRPAKAEVESREETIERALDEAEQAQDVHAHKETVDPTTRRGVNRTIARHALVFAGIGAVVGAVLGVVLSFLPGPVETDSAAGAVGYAAVMAVLVAVIFGLIATLILLAREDGRVEREVEQTTGHAPERPGDPIDPKYDVEGS
jgi:Flp pilus assembly protein TadB